MKHKATKAKKPPKRIDAISAFSDVSAKAGCGLCHKTAKLMLTECCKQWICDDEENYVMFSYERNSCSRNHRRYTLCGHHHSEQHAGDWRSCEACRQEFPTEMYVYYGTNEYNFETLKNPPKFEPTRCGKCNNVIRLGYEGYTLSQGNYICAACYEFPFESLLTEPPRKKTKRNRG